MIANFEAIAKHACHEIETHYHNRVAVLRFGFASPDRNAKNTACATIYLSAAKSPERLEFSQGETVD